jgi:hypothetical protein
MKAHLKELDPESLGRVPLGLFYAQPAGATYHFAESADYLRQIGALDETSPGNPQVYIANYVAGPSNCIASSAYYSVCCLSECDEIMGDLERHIIAPSASPETILALVRNISHANVERTLVEKLRLIAERHGGEVPLHGRLFAQWLHFAFPHECPYPSIVGSATALSASQWLDGRSTASAEERKMHVGSTPSEEVLSAQETDIHGRWSDHEVLPVYHETRSQSFQGAMRIFMQLSALFVALRSALAAWRSSGLMRSAASKKDDDFLLPLRV